MGLESIFKLSVILNLIDNLTSPAQNAFGGIMKTGAMLTGAGAQLAHALTAPVTASFDTKSALAELSSLGVTELELLEDAASKFSDTWAGTTKADFISAAYDIKSGIASLTDEGVAQYTEMAGLTAKATKANIATMTDLFATGYGIYKGFYTDLSDMEFAELFSAGISTSVKQFKTNGNEMAAAIQSLGASATNAQVPLEEQLSILGMLQATMSGSEAGTKYNAFLRSAAKGGEALGLSFVDANNQLLSMPEILDMLHGKFGNTLDAAEKMELQKAFGDSETIKLIDLMYGKVGDLENNILGMYDSLGQGTAATLEMADAINSSDPAKVEVMKQKLHNIGETISNIVAPNVMQYMDKISGVIDKTGEWISSHGELVNVIFNVLAALAVFLTISGTVTTLIGFVGGQITSWISLGKAAKGAITNLITAMQPMIASVWSFTSALLANPVTWIVIGIVALVAAIVLLYNKCEWFRNIVDSIFAVIKEKFGAALETAQNVFGGIADVIGAVMGAARDTITEKLSNMKQAYEEHGGGIKGAAAAAIEGIKGLHTAGFTFLDNLTGGKLTEIKNKWSEKLAPVKEITDNIMNAAKDTVVEKLSNMKQAYESHGGGIRGIAAAAIEGVKGYYTAGFTFMDNLTGGKLTAIREKFSQGIQGIKDKITDSISWFKNSGKKIMDTFTEGIKSAVDKPVEMVKGALQKIRNMLPFSDAKEGPLSSLTLSGSKVLSTMAEGIRLTEDLPAQEVETALGRVDLTLQKSGQRQKEDNAEKAEETAGEQGRQTVRHISINNLNLNVDLKDIESIQKIKKLLEEIENNIYSSGDGTPEPA